MGEKITGTVLVNGVDRDVIYIDAERAIELLRECVTERGADYVYTPEDTGISLADRPGQSCLNWHRTADVPGCIVGLALNKAGVTGEDFRDAHSDGDGADSATSDLPMVFATKRASRMLGYVQERQDRGAPWGEAVDALVSSYETRYFDGTSDDDINGIENKEVPRP